MAPDGDQLISIIIPVFNGRRYLGEAIQSVLDQDEPGPLEIIVVDDGSDDGSGDLAASFDGVIVHRQANGGIGAARNAGVAIARGTYLAFLDADDRWLPAKLRRQRRLLDNRPEIDFVLSAIEVTGDHGRTPLHHASGLIPSAIMVRRKAFEQVGPFTTDVHLGEFIDWYARATDLGLRHNTDPEVGVLRRIHDQNTGLRERDRRTDYARVLKSVLDRRRGGA